ncbi:MAG: hypothetical protein JW776_14575 [Candidatus Lokiarchaeota archaeon]|nr:hypothetical protein [Candidatus Lokiarchaeota archaeon]
MKEKPKVVQVECPQCHEVITIQLDNLIFEGQYAKIVYTHGTFGIKPHSIIIDIDKNYVPKQVVVADRTYTKIG